MNLQSFLKALDERFGSETAAFQIAQFQGTGSELRTQVATWARSDNIHVSHLDIPELVSSAANPQAARTAVETALRGIAETTGQMLLTIAGAHLLAVLYPAGLTQPINKWVRRSGRVVILSVPPSHSLALPQSAFVTPWREGIASHLGNENTIQHGGA